MSIVGTQVYLIGYSSEDVGYHTVPEVFHSIQAADAYVTSHRDLDVYRRIGYLEILERTVR